MNLPFLFMALIVKSIPFKKTIWWCILLPLPIFAQNISIQISPLDHSNLTKSLIVLSSPEGVPVFEHILTEDEIYNGSTYTIPAAEENHMLTLINQYVVDTLNKGEPFNQAFSYCEIGKQINVLRFQHPKSRPFYHDKFINMEILNCPELEEFHVYTAGHMRPFKKVNPGNKLWMQVNYGPDEDIFITFKSKFDSKYKYIYIEADKIVKKDRYDYLTYDWKLLPSDLIHVDIKPPFANLINGYIRGINTETNNTCYFFKADSLLDLTSDLKLLIPSRISFSDIKTKLKFKANTPVQNAFYTYVICHGSVINLPKHGPELFSIEDYQTDSTTIKGILPPLPEYYKVTYAMYPSRPLQSGDKLYHLKYSYWEVYGKNNETLNVNLPQFSAGILKDFFDETYSERSWWLQQTELIKVIETEYADIDWINFLTDYNLVYVQPFPK